MLGDQVYIKREWVKQGTSKKLSTVFDDLSTIIETNHPIYKVKRTGSGKEGWIHYNRLRRKDNFLVSPQIQTKFVPQHQSESSISVMDQDDDTISEIDFPIIINNSRMNRDNQNPISPAEVSGDREQFDETPVISLDGAQTGTTRTIGAHSEDPSTMQGLTFNDEGRRVSTRVRRPTTNDAFKY